MGVYPVLCVKYMILIAFIEVGCEGIKGFV